MLEAGLVAAGTVFVAEFGDKSQLLAVLLAARFRRPWTVLAGMAAGVAANQALAGLVGALLAASLPDEVRRWLVAGGFTVAALWSVWQRDARAPQLQAAPGWGAFAASAAAFFLAEMGDKTQLVTVALTAKFQAPLAVVAGATVGLLAAAVPAVLFADRLLARLPERLLRWLAAALFLLVAAAALWA